MGVIQTMFDEGLADFSSLINVLKANDDYGMIWLYELQIQSDH